jgi:hypothetical protein
LLCVFSLPNSFSKIIKTIAIALLESLEIGCDRIRKLSTLALEALGIVLLDFSEVADLVAWLQQKEVSD